ncbi:MAG: DegQ family serine endoprotease [Rhodocyclaceae bacterium]|nr:DegQ family serine endoprotease [Rhodocyclaceae bacterium]
MNPISKRFTLAAAVAASFAGGYVLHDQVGIPDARAVTPPVAVASAATPAPVLPDFAAIAAEVGPAVVNISVAGNAKTAARGMPEIGPDSPLYEFLRRFGAPVPEGRVPSRGVGSGFIVSPEGTILTNAHVVADADEVTVRLSDKREFKAKVVGIDRLTDVAVLRIDARGLPTVKVGDSGQARVGEWVMAIGSPFGFESSVTAGIISAKARTLPDEGYVPFMQTDVAINPGNSGGPLINARGEVIGINSQIYSRSGGYQGLSFAIPIDVAMDVERQLVSHGKVSRGRLGVSIQEVDQALAESFGLDRPRGALVSGVEPGSPAARAGLQSGDVILQYNGKPVARSSELPAMVAGTSPGGAARLEIWRKGAAVQMDLKVGEMQVASAGGAAPDAVPAGGLGLVLRPLAAAEKAQVDGGRGLVVERVGDGPAARAGIRPGDVILAANGESVGDVAELQDRVRQSGKGVALLVQRGERRIFVPLRIG